MNFKRSLCFSLFFVLFCFGLMENVFSQERERIVRDKQDAPTESRLTHQQPFIITRNLSAQIPNLSVKSTAQNSSLVKKIVSSQPLNAPVTKSISKNFYSASLNSRLLQSIQAKIGTPYHYGSTGPNSYDCSGLVWSVFQDAGFFFERSSARTLWQNSESVNGDDRFEFGTLVFFNRLGHIGIVADKDGFYHASSSKGVTYSPFDGYWGKRIVGYRRLLTIAN